MGVGACSVSYSPPPPPRPLRLFITAVGILSVPAVPAPGLGHVIMSQTASLPATRATPRLPVPPGWLEDEPARVTSRMEIRPAAEMGPIILCLDTSGSMRGARETVAKALALECLRGAHRQRRQCYLYAFSGPSEWRGPLRARRRTGQRAKGREGQHGSGAGRGGWSWAGRDTGGSTVGNRHASTTCVCCL